jgi:hypothetical protein
LTDAPKPLTDEELDRIERILQPIEGGLAVTEPLRWSDVLRLVAEVRDLRLDSQLLAVHHERVSAAVTGPCPVCATLDQQSRSQP